MKMRDALIVLDRMTHEREQAYELLRRCRTYVERKRDEKRRYMLFGGEEDALLAEIDGVLSQETFNENCD